MPAERSLTACQHLQAWPSTIRTVYGDQDRYETTYFAPFKARASSVSSCMVGLVIGW